MQWKVRLIPCSSEFDLLFSHLAVPFRLLFGLRCPPVPGQPCDLGGLDGIPQQLRAAAERNERHGRPGIV